MFTTHAVLHSQIHIDKLEPICRLLSLRHSTLCAFTHINKKKKFQSKSELIAFADNVCHECVSFQFAS